MYSWIPYQNVTQMDSGLDPERSHFCMKPHGPRLHNMPPCWHFGLSSSHQNSPLSFACEYLGVPLASSSSYSPRFSNKLAAKDWDSYGPVCHSKGRTSLFQFSVQLFSSLRSIPDKKQLREERFVSEHGWKNGPMLWGYEYEAA